MNRSIPEALAKALSTRGYTTLTPVQEAVSDAELSGADMLVSAQTGSGKTVGFGIAIAANVLGDADRLETAGSPLALVIAPTRELALQVKRELAWLYEDAGAVLASCVGGMDMRDERRTLARGAHIVVATPGRLRDHITRGSIDLSGIRAVVLDEADEMLDLGFREDLEFILSEAPEDRQTLMFSATVPAAIARLAENYQREAHRISTTSGASQHADIEYIAHSVAPRDVENAIINVLRFHEAPNAIVFANTRAMVARLTTRLSNRGFSVVSLSGELSQSERTHALQAMRDGRARVCVATDVAARGIDLPNLDLVVHAELPSSHETLLHRSGRTGRAGRKGTSALIVPPAAKKKAHRILQFAKLKATWAEAPSANDVREKDGLRMLSDPIWQTPPEESEAETIAQLTAHFSPEQLAAAYLRLYSANHSAPEELMDADTPGPERAPFGPSVWFALALGRHQDAEPRRLLPMICKAGGLDKTAIGAIRVRPDTSYIELRKTAVPDFLKAIGPEMSVEGHALTQLDAPPAGLDDKPKGKPKGPYEGKPKGKPGAGPKPHRKGPAADRPDAPPRAKPPQAKPYKARKSDDGPKGPPPPKSKPNSKKNKARKAEAAATKKPRKPKA